MAIIVSPAMPMLCRASRGGVKVGVVERNPTAGAESAEALFHHESRTWKPKQLSQLLRQLLRLFNTTVVWFKDISKSHSIYLIWRKASWTIIVRF